MLFVLLPATFDWMNFIYIIQSHNCDGGHQEYATAEHCIKSIFPNCTIVAKRVNSYPIRVLIQAQQQQQQQQEILVNTTSSQSISQQGGDVVIWEGRQQDLFRKNASKRTESIQIITTNLQKFKDTLSTRNDL